MTNDPPRSDNRLRRRRPPNGRSAQNGNSDPLCAHPWIETDGGEHERRERFPHRSPKRSNGGTANGDDPELVTYSNEEYGYSVDYPADWSVEADASGGATFEDTTSTAGAVVFVDEDLEADLVGYAERFQENLAADDHVYELEQLDQRTVRLPGSHRGRVVECGYVGDAPDERWRLTYLFVVADETGYTVGIDWAAGNGFEAIARTIVDSFTLATDSTE